MNEKNGTLDPSLKSLLERRFALFLSPLESFIHKQTTSSIFLVAFSLLALLGANSRWQALIPYVQNLELGLILGAKHASLSAGEWVSQGLMALFFFLTGLEIKREILAGKLQRFSEVSIIVFAALGGIIVPAIIYTVINYGEPGQHGWGISTATDTAFAIGILALMASRVSVGMTVFLTALSIFDDIGAVFIISFFYAHNIDLQALSLAALVFAALLFVNRTGVRNGWVYAALGFLLWIFVYKAGIHATSAGLLLAMTIPARATISQSGFIHNIHGLIKRFEQKQTGDARMLASSGQHSIVSDIGRNVNAASTPLQRWELSMIMPIGIIVLPVFALFNAGIHLSAPLIAASMQSPVTLGVIAGLVIGKPLGILLFAFMGLKLKVGKLPEGVGVNEMVGIAFLAGIGFTMSIFFATLSFAQNPDLIEPAKLGILISSILSAVAGSAWIFFRLRKGLRI